MRRSASKAVLADTGYWLALANPKDAWHRAAVLATERVSQRLVVTWPVITETCHLLGRFGGTNAQTSFIDLLRTSADIYPQDAAQLSDIADLMDKYRDTSMDLADASLVAAATELRDGRILSSDERDFEIYRWGGREPFENLLTTFRRE